MTRAARPLLLVLMLLACASVRGADYRIDTARSHAEFSVRLLWVRQINGRFTEIHGEVTLSPLRDSAVVEATVAVDSVAMASARLRRWVLDPEFFDVRRFPQIHFVSAPLAVRSLDRGGELPGWLTMRGVTRPVQFRLEPASCTLARGSVCRIEVRGSVHRSDYGMDGHSTAVSDTVQLGLLITLDPA
ncbi:YceI family protein [Dyella sp.]|jgi:polyisoprenoid-binding protein YceI|uniref:YceI family protein n=1 Tax=Dyella sp. TaxID=1869338 RepID=UPI002D79554D|nr:YceI family protein [Dyella sp.]HET6433003.1 YceI family protein [Dyella sp.]